MHIDLTTVQNQPLPFHLLALNDLRFLAHREGANATPRSPAESQDAAFEEPPEKTAIKTSLNQLWVVIGLHPRGLLAYGIPVLSILQHFFLEIPQSLSSLSYEASLQINPPIFKTGKRKSTKFHADGVTNPHRYVLIRPMRNSERINGS